MNFQDDYKCPMCDSRHAFRTCRKFLVLSPFDKGSYLRKKKFCVNCLGISHEILKCPCQHGCHICHMGHHTLLHGYDELTTDWLCMTAWARVQCMGLINEPTAVRLLLNPNADESYFIPNLGFPLELEQTPDKLKAVLTPLRNKVRTLTITLRQVCEPTYFSPRIPLKMDRVFNTYPREDLADYAPHLPYVYSVVLGKDASSRIYLGLPVKEKGLPYAQNTIFGWCFFGDQPIFRD